MEGGSDLDRNLGPGREGQPWIEVRSPDGATRIVDLDQPVLRIGREAGWTDLRLEPDDRRWISRRHCRIERQGSGWAVVDEGSRNGTFVRGTGTLTRVDASTTLTSGDTVVLLASMDGPSAVYWELVFHDPELTAPAAFDHPGVGLDYDWVEGRAYVVDGPARTEVALRPQEHRLVRHLAARNRDTGGAALCSHEELIAAVWGEETYQPHTRDDLARLVYELRRRLEADPSRPRLLQTVRGFGYRLVTLPS